jgi:hypothetical protein
MRSFNHRFSSHQESSRNVLTPDNSLGLVSKPRYVPRLPPACQSAVAWKYKPGCCTRAPKSMSTVPRTRFQLASLSGCTLLIFQRDAVPTLSGHQAPEKVRHAAIRTRGGRSSQGTAEQVASALRSSRLILRSCTRSNSAGEAAPRFDLRHYSPKTKWPNSSPKCLTCSGSLAARNRSARSKNSRSFRLPWQAALP